MKKQLKKEILIGPYPPPIGGVSNHIKRYSENNNVEIIKHDTLMSFSNIIYLLKQQKTKFYLHSASPLGCLILYLKSKILNLQCEYFFINHNFQIIISNRKDLAITIKKFIWKLFFRNCKKVYVVNVDLIEKMKKIYGILNYSLFDPYVPPKISDEQKVLKTYNKNVTHFIKTHYPIISSGAWQLSFHNGIDLYGFDLIINATNMLNQYFNNIGVILFVGNPYYNEAYIDELKKRILKYGLDNNILIITGQKEMWPILKISDIYVRATNTDGNPLSIKEALHFGTTVVGSDCTMREEDVFLFKNRDYYSLVKIILKIQRERMNNNIKS